jgi:AraC-like DNA-binding protein
LTGAKAESTIEGMELAIHRGTCALGDWSYARWCPAGLSEHVDHLWRYVGPTVHTKKRVFPNGCIELLFNFAEPYRLLEGRGDERLGAGFVGGPHLGPILLEQPAWQDCLAVRLRPRGAFEMLGGPLSELAGLSVRLEDVLGNEAAPLTERLALAPGTRAKFRLLAGWLAARARRGRTMDRAIAWAVGELADTAGGRPIAVLRERTGLSKAAFVAGFRDQVGLEPKRYARVTRFHRVLSELQDDGSRRLVEVALGADYYDQAHMNAEFKQLGGITPRQFLAARHPVGDGTTAAG